MFGKVCKAFLQGFDIFFLEVLLIDAAVHLESPDGSDDDDGIRFDPGETALDVHELFSAEVGTETGFRNGDIAHFHGQFHGDDGVAAVGDVGKGAAVNQGRRMFDSLNEVRLDGIFHEDGHGPFNAELTSRNQVAVEVVATVMSPIRFLRSMSRWQGTELP